MTKKLLILIVLLFTGIPTFAQSVDTVWVRRYDTGEYYEGGKAIVVDAFGNCYVTGSTITIAYNPEGNELWVTGWGGADITLDAFRNIYVIGGTWTYSTVKYYPNGDTAWLRKYDGSTNGGDCGFAIAVNLLGEVYVTGTSWDNETSDDYATVKYDSLGNELWVRKYNGPGNGHDEAFDITLDLSGNVYVTGRSTGNATGIDYTTIKYDPNGNKQWERRYNGPGNGYDWAKRVALDGSGNICVTGYSYGGIQTNYDYATLKYNSSGDQVWIKRYNGPGNGDDVATDISIDRWDNIYVTGWSRGSDSHDDYATIKYDNSGNELWVKRYETKNVEQANALTVDSNGNVYVTGRNWRAINWCYDYLTIKYDKMGNECWIERYDGPISDYDWASAIVTDTSGNVYVTGTSAGDYLKYNGHWEPLYDYASIKYVQGGTSVEEENTKISQLTLCQNYPNPFNTETIIEYSLKKIVYTNLKIFNIKGQLVKTLVNQRQDPAVHRCLGWKR